jgi:hypothetical protein
MRDLLTLLLDLPDMIALTGFFAYLWVELLRQARARYRQRIGQFGKARRVAPYVNDTTARQAASARRLKIEATLREVNDRGVVFQEFIEVPPDLQIAVNPSAQAFGDDESEPFWHTALLSIQQESDQHLLIERVTDAVVCLERAGFISREQFPSNIRLERLPSGAAGGDKFPWRVVIATDHPEKLEAWLGTRAAREWVGIGIDLVPASLPVAKSINRDRESGDNLRPANPTAGAHGACRLGDDVMYGVVGGVVLGDDDEYGVTCRHVVSSECGALVWPGQPVRPPSYVYTQRSPDVAFVNLRHACKPKGVCFVGPERPGEKVAALDQTAISTAVDSGALLKKAPADDGTRGVVLAAHVSSFKLKEYSYRGAHVMIVPKFYKQWLLTWPLSRRFSVAGDSGSWVLDAKTGAWLGMIVGGSLPPNTQTYAVAANYVLRAFKLFKKSKSPLRAKVFSER